MSAKIYNGFRLTEGADPFAFSAAWREALSPVRERCEVKSVLHRCLRDIATSDIKGEARKSNPLADASSEHYVQGARDFGSMPSGDPFGFAVHLVRDSDSGRIMGRYIGSENDLVEAFMGLDEVEEYAYWNNTDERPDGVDESQWRKRREDWFRVQGHKSIADVSVSAILSSRAASLVRPETILSEHADLLRTEALENGFDRARYTLRTVMDAELASVAQGLDAQEVIALLTMDNSVRPSREELETLGALFVPLTFDNLVNQEAVQEALPANALAAVDEYRQRVRSTIRRRGR